MRVSEIEIVTNFIKLIIKLKLLEKKDLSGIRSELIDRAIKDLR